MKNNNIYFSWDIHYRCNFRCPYCWFYKDWATLNKRNIYLSPDEWMIHWRRIYDKYGELKIELVGGEPFIYPNFIELVKKLSSIHLLKVTTNLSGDIEHFAETINPERVNLDLNFHILFIDLETVIKKALILKKAGFKAGICYLAYPPQMHKIKNLSERFKKEGINFALAAFWGEYNGKKYPQAYTEEEKELMRPYLGDINRITYHLDAKSPKGRLCSAGYKYASIQADGNVVRCGPLGANSIGNIMDENFRLLENPLPCGSDVCPCNEYENIIENEKVKPGFSSDDRSENDIEIISIATKKDKLDADSIKLPIFLRTAPPYRVHWNWELSYRCNYHCSYCPWWKKGKEEKNTFFENIELDTWRRIWDGIFEKYWCSHIRFSGGEPTIYPNFFDLVSVLLEKHTVDITTNLSFDISMFMKKIKSSGISISASLHPEFDRIGPFLEKVLLLHHNGYPSTISYVAYPPHLEEIRNFKLAAEKERIMFKIIPYQGEFNGKCYPRDYTAQEKCLMEGLSEDSLNTHLNELNKRWYDWNVKRDREDRDKKGELCRMGEMYAKINPDGKVSRCCARDKDGSLVGVLGDILDTSLRLLDTPKPCEANNCPCFKSMHVGFEEDRWLSLWEAPEHPVYKTSYIKELLALKTTSESNNSVILATQKEEVENDNKKTEIDSQLIHPSRVFFTWDIHYACNYRCTYCFFSKRWDEVAKENRYVGIDRWKAIWDGIFKRYGTGHIHFSGGEPFTYPSFIDLVAYLSQEYTVEFDTNLSFDIMEFILKIKPSRAKFAASFHPEFVGIGTFLEKALFLKEEGYDIGINFVAYPAHLEGMKEYKEKVISKHLSFDIMPFRGEYQGRNYPKEYTEEEKRLIKECDSQTAAKMLETYGGDKKNSRKGELCRMGQMYTKIHPDGTAYRCCFINDGGKLGNLIDDTFSLYEKPKICEYDECPCWVAMIVEKEKDWAFHWKTPKVFKEINIGTG